MNGLDKVGTMTNQELRAEIERLKAEMAAQGSRRISFRVSTKGAVSVYGLGRYPTTLYASQWEQLFAAVPELKAFISAHTTELSIRTARDPDAEPVSAPASE
jgi:hypothetical protein